MQQSQHTLVNKTYTIWGIILIVWALYRVYGPRMPEWVDELILKPLVFLGPVLLFVKVVEKRPLASIGLTAGKFFRDIYIGIGFGMLFAVEGMVANAIKHGTFSFAPVIPIAGNSLVWAVIFSFATAISEETLARGFLYSRFKEGYGDRLKAMVVSSAMYFMLLVPFIFVVSKLTGVSLLIFVMTNIVISLANTMIFEETKTLTVPILIHAFWNMAVALYL